MDPEQDIDEQKTYQTIQTSNALPPAEDPKRASGFLCGGTSTPPFKVVASLPSPAFTTTSSRSSFIISPYPSILSAECGAENHLQSKEAVRCRECGYRIMYKKRARRRTLMTWSHALPHPHNNVSHACSRFDWGLLLLSSTKFNLASTSYREPQAHLSFFRFAP
jgi:DNA-directed RNA polymerase subunit RPC12/RpoP